MKSTPDASIDFISQGPEETARLGEQWGREAARGLVIGLSGDLGAGKTELVKGVARGLAIAARVHSPTFTLLNEYSGGRLPLFHLDLYRLETRDDVMGAGLEEYLFNPVGVAVVEWIERWLGEDGCSGACPPRYRRARIEITGEKQRRIRYEDFGA